MVDPLVLVHVMGLMQELQDRVAKARDCNEEMMSIWKETVDFHGEMVLLENYSALNYTGIFFSFFWSFCLYSFNNNERCGKNIN